ncbi:MAG: helix-hairpin-helix domain-containing protein, partial [Candidatus Omnitrophica bacterium]|nr:helix-hairpin-helix domain-containing protein [Candidatus Omnitrophota bacterium]
MTQIKDYSKTISQELGLKELQVRNTSSLIDSGSTIPFISRYRKELTGSLDEVMVGKIRDRLNQLRELDKRRDAILESIKEQGKLTDELKDMILSAQSLSVLEDLYLPYKPKRRTKATVAKEKGLEPLAKLIFEQKAIALENEAKKYINAEKKVASVEEALAGARDIIAEWINEDAALREKLRKLFREEAVLKTKIITGKEEAGVNFKDYYDFSEIAHKSPSHRILASRRGEKEGFLTLRVLPAEVKAFEIIISHCLRAKNSCAEQVKESCIDSYKRLLSPSLETEYRVELKLRADQEAISIFGKNLKNLLMAPPMGQKKVMAIDPGLRTGSKVVCLNEQGKLLDHTTIFLLSENGQGEAADKICSLYKKYSIEVIAIGNGTGSRETENFLKGIEELTDVKTIMVSETGASVYSASECAREEFPDHDVTVRGAVSIGRRLMDPLSELVKIDPKSIGVGQYQHDVDQRLLKNALDDIVESCVNSVGVEVNTSSKELLTYVSGLGPARAKAIIDFRNEKGKFKERKNISQVPGLGPKAVEQAIGFLRIFDSPNPLDKSAVHPEAYPIVEAMAKTIGQPIERLIGNSEIVNKIDI